MLLPGLPATCAPAPPAQLQPEVVVALIHPHSPGASGRAPMQPPPPGEHAKLLHPALVLELRLPWLAALAAHPPFLNASGPVPGWPEGGPGTQPKQLTAINRSNWRRGQFRGS